jgi:hypothetical protein
MGIVETVDEIFLDQAQIGLKAKLSLAPGKHFQLLDRITATWKNSWIDWAAFLAISKVQ